MFNFARKGIIMATIQINNPVSPLDALWAHFLSLPESVQQAFVKRLKKSEETFAYGDSSATRKARVLHRNYRYNDAELEKLLEKNPELPYEPAADVHNIVSGSKGKALDNFKHWM